MCEDVGVLECVGTLATGEAVAVGAEAGRLLGLVGFLEGGGHGVGGHVQVLAEVLNALVGEGVVEPLPAEVLLHVAWNATTTSKREIDHMHDLLRQTPYKFDS